MFSFIIISIISSIISGIGIGGGSIFILLVTILNLLDYKTAIVYNLIMYIVSGFTASLTNIKNKKFDKKLFFKIIFLSLMGSFIGTYFAKGVETDQIKKYFYIFIMLLGLYEIISSLISIKNEKNITRWKEMFICVFLEELLLVLL